MEINPIKRTCNILTFLILILQVGVANSELENLYDQGLNAYKNGQYEFSIQNFEKILSSDWESPELYYNLGNAHYQSDNIAGAVWAYEQCLKIDPLNTDAKYNLQLANLKVKDRINMPEPPFLLKLFWKLKSTFTPTGWIQLWGLIFIAIAVFFAIRKILDYPSVKLVEILLSILLLISIFPGGFSIWDQFTIHQGIIDSPEIHAFSAPSAFSTQLFQVHEGLKVDILDVTDDWTEIELMDGKVGWIESEKIKMLTH